MNGKMISSDWFYTSRVFFRYIDLMIDVYVGIIVWFELKGWKK